MNLRAIYSKGPHTITKYLDGAIEIHFLDEKRALGFVGKQGKPTFHRIFKTKEARDEYINGFIDRWDWNLKERAKQAAIRKAVQAEDRAKLAAYCEPGAMLYDSWGYEQTQVEFYQVLQRKGFKVLLQEVGHTDIGATSSVSCQVIPNMASKIGEPAWFTIGAWGIKINDSIKLSPYDGKPKHRSWGH